MATQQLIAALRQMINQPENIAPWTDEYLSGLLDSQQGDLASSAASAWRIKAAAYAELVDVAEGSSRRSLSQLYKQALEMATSYAPGAGDGTLRPPRSPRVTEIVRP